MEHLKQFYVTTEVHSMELPVKDLETFLDAMLEQLQHLILNQMEQQKDPIDF